MTDTATDLLLDRGIAALLTFRESHGHGFVPPAYVTADGWRLGEFASRLRRASLAGALTRSQEAALDRAGLDRAAGADAFAAGLDALRRFRVREGHAIVPAWHVEDGFRLGEWRAARLAELGRGALRGERRAALERLGFMTPAPRRATAARVRRPFAGRRADGRRDPAVIAARQERIDAWSAERFAEGLAELRLFAENEGHVRVPSRYETPSGYRLGQWCWWLRGKRRDGRLGPERVDELDGLGFCWDPRAADFAHGLAEWQAAGGTEPVRTASGFALRAWCRRMRAQHDAGELDAERVAALEAAGFPWRLVSAREADWGAGMAALDALLARGSGPWVPVQFAAPDGFHLGAWLNRQRIAWRAGRLSPLEVTALAHRGVSPSFDHDRLVWGMRSLRQFRDTHPGRQPAQSYVDPDGFALGNWFVVRRREARTGTLDHAVAALFEELGIDAFLHPRPLHESREAAWSVALNAYRAWTAADGRRFPPRGTLLPDGRDLAVWVQNQRIDLRLGRATPDRRAALEAAGLDEPAVVRVTGAAAFAVALSAFRAFVLEHGHDRVPLSVLLPDGRSLGRTVHSWRSALARGTVSAERRTILEAAGLTTAPRRRGPIGRPMRLAPARPAPDHLGRHLRTWREIHAVSAEEAAVALGISKASVVALEQHRHRTPPKLAVVGRVAELIGIDRRRAALLAGWDRDDVDAIYGRRGARARGRAA